MVDFQVAIDGPAGSGKSSISNLVATKLGFVHIDTGAMYRAVTLEALNRKINLENETEYSFVNDIDVEYRNGRIFLNSVDVSDKIRSQEVTRNVSTVSKFGIVRTKMVEFQRKSASSGKVLMDGRDIGSVVLKNANLKVFLTASPEERANRRLLEFAEKGEKIDYETVLADIIARDYKDSHRAISPLVQASDAILIDTTNMTIEEVCNKIIKLINVRLESMNEDIKMSEVITKKIKVRDIVTGEIVSVKDNEIAVDLNNFTEGTMYLNYYTKDSKASSFKDFVKVGDTITCEVTSVNEERGQILLSRLNLIQKENFAKLKDVVDSKESISVKVSKKVNKGFMVSYKGFQFFLHESQAPANCEVGQVFDVRLLELEERTSSGKVSRKVIEKEEYGVDKKNEFDSFIVGDIVTGEIGRIEPFGLFIKFKYNQGLVRINQVSHTFIKDLTQEFKVGDKIEVKVLNKDNGKLSLSRKALLKTPFELYVEEHKVSDVVKGKVVNKLAFGLIIELAADVRGLLHQNEFSWNPNDNFNNFVKIGDEVEAAIINITAKGEKISLSRKALMDNPWVRVTAKEGDIVEATITAFEPKFMKVQACGVDGIIPSFDALAEDANGKMDDFYAIGDKVTAIITEIDPKAWVLKLSVKKHLQNLERAQYEKYMKNEQKEEVTTLGDLFKDVLK